MKFYYTKDFVASLYKTGHRNISQDEKTKYISLYSCELEEYLNSQGMVVPESLKILHPLDSVLVSCWA
jgi:hypothetical protein